MLGGYNLFLFKAYFHARVILLLVVNVLMLRGKGSIFKLWNTVGR